MDNEYTLTVKGREIAVRTCEGLFSPLAPDRGTLDVAKKVRGRKAALAEILRGVLDDLAEIDPTGTEIDILQADCRADAEYVRGEIKKAFPMVGEINITALGVVIGAHCGPGLLTVFYLCGGRRP